MTRLTSLLPCARATSALPPCSRARASASQPTRTHLQKEWRSNVAVALTNTAAADAPSCILPTPDSSRSHTLYVPSLPCENRVGGAQVRCRQVRKSGSMRRHFNLHSAFGNRVGGVGQRGAETLYCLFVPVTVCIYASRGRANLHLSVSAAVAGT